MADVFILKLSRDRERFSEESTSFLTGVMQWLSSDSVFPRTFPREGFGWAKRNG